VLAKQDPGLLAAATAPLAEETVRLARETLLAELTAESPSSARVGAARYLLDRALGRPVRGLGRLEEEMLRLQIREAQLRVLLLEREAEGKGLALGADLFDPLADP
jgi:hypothetical protein